MEGIKLNIDGIEVSGAPGMTILEAARSVGVEIPTLCHNSDLAPTGCCRICVVEVEGNRTLVGACHTPAAEGMVVKTSSPRVQMARKATIELLMAGHTGECVSDERTGDCSLRELADQLECGAPRFRMRRPRWYPVEEFNPYVRRDMSKCVLCRRCVSACREIAKKNIFSLAYRGFSSKVVVAYDENLTTDLCRDCGVCIDYCPTGALSKPTRTDGVAQISGDRESKAPPERARTELLEKLKEAQREHGSLSRTSVSEIAQSMGAPLSEVYGVATFYSFLSIRPRGKYIIRICKSVPCYMKHSEMIIESVARTIGIKPGETTPDGKFSFELTNCIGACDMAPAMLLNDQVHGRLTPDKIASILTACA